MMSMSRFLFISFFSIISVATASEPDCVVLLHGLARTEKSMIPLENKLVEAGYQVVNQAYPSREYSVETLAELSIPPALDACKENSTVHFVTHSLGGILLRQYLSDIEIPRLGRSVMLGPPNQGSEIVDSLGSVPGFHAINGDAGLQLGTGENSVPLSLGDANFEVGIIAGERSINWILSLIIPGPDDGKVSVTRTRLAGMKDHIVMPVTHPMMMQNKKVISEVIYFLEEGNFTNNYRKEQNLETESSADDEV